MMRVLLSTIGSRGDVQPMVALALALQRLGHDACLCAPPDFGEWVRGMGIEFVPVGPEVRGTALPRPAGDSGGPSAEQMRRILDETVAGQFEALTAASEGYDLMVAGMALQFALRSVAEYRGVPYVYAAWCPVTLPSDDHAPPPLPFRPQRADGEPRTLWRADAERWNEQWAGPINRQRALLGLAPVAEVRSHIFTERPWLAADPVLAPWLGSEELEVVQTGAWLVEDERPLPNEVEAFLDAGEKPVYFGFGSMRAPEGLSRAMVDAARAVGRRAIVSQGWAGVTLPDEEADCLLVGELNQQALFRRVAAVVHHGGAGTTTTAARAGVAQVVAPQIYDQHYWARRVEALGIGVAHGAGAPSGVTLEAALELALRSEVAARARALEVRGDGAEKAAQLASLWRLESILE